MQIYSRPTVIPVQRPTMAGATRTLFAKPLPMAELSASAFEDSKETESTAKVQYVSTCLCSLRHLFPGKCSCIIIIFIIIIIIIIIIINIFNVA